MTLSKCDQQQVGFPLNRPVKNPAFIGEIIGNNRNQQNVLSGGFMCNKSGVLTEREYTFWCGFPFNSKKDSAMKLVGTYNSPCVRKVSVMLLEKGITFKFINRTDSDGNDIVSRYHPLGKVPVFIDDNGAIWFDSAVIIAFLEQPIFPPVLTPADPLKALEDLRLQALADGVINAATILNRELKRPSANHCEPELLLQREKIDRSLDWLETQISQGTINAATLTPGVITVGCAMGFINQQRLAQGWCASRPLLVRLIDQLFQRESFARTEPSA